MTRSIEQETVAGPLPVPHVTKVDVRGDFVLRLEFDDGSVREIDLGPELRGPVFGPLKDRTLFQQVRVDPESGTIVWPNGADLAPEFLHGRPPPPPAD